jgi:hypothetical protein
MVIEVNWCETSVSNWYVVTQSRFIPYEKLKQQKKNRKNSLQNTGHVFYASDVHCVLATSLLEVNIQRF